MAEVLPSSLLIVTKTRDLELGPLHRPHQVRVFQELQVLALKAQILKGRVEEQGYLLRYFEGFEQTAAQASCTFTSFLLDALAPAYHNIS